MDNLREQFSNIYDQYIGKIYRFVYLKVGSQEVAEDLTSKVFLKGWESFAKDSSSISNHGAFLYQIARNSVIDYYREKGKTKLVSSDAIIKAVDPKTNLHNEAILSSDMVLVRSAIASLKQDYQDIIIWHYLESMDVPEIALVMGKPAGTVRVMLHRGLKALKEELKGKVLES